MEQNYLRAEILAIGMVQGVGFRYFVYRNALKLGLKGYTMNLYDDEKVLTEVEGNRASIEELFRLIRIGPSNATVNDCIITWKEYTGEFNLFEIRY